MIDYRIFVLFSLILSAAYTSAAQSKYSQHIMYDSLVNKARQQEKLMFFLVHQRDEQFSPYDSLTVSRKTRDILQEEFVSGMVRIAPDDIHHPVLKAYHLSAPTYFFTDKDGYPLLRYNKQIKQEDTLLKLIDSTKTIAQGETMGKLIAQYKKGFRSPALLRKLLEQYQVFDRYLDQQVLNDYVAQLRVQELNNFETVVFLLRCGPVYDSQAYRMAYTNRKMIDSLYTTMPLPVRKAINSRMNQRNFREALDKKNFSMALNLGDRVANTWQPNHLRGNITRSYYPMKYLWSVQDTTRYLPRAKDYYDTFFYRLDQDSLAKLDYAYNQKINISYRGPVMDSAENECFQKWLEKNRPHYVKTQVNNLNYGANQLLNFGKDNSEILFDAIRWMQRSIELIPDRGDSRYILAKLLYQVGFHAEAIAEQQRAVELYKPQKRHHKRMQDVLKQMRDGSWSGS